MPSISYCSGELYNWAETRTMRRLSADKRQIGTTIRWLLMSWSCIGSSYSVVRLIISLPDAAFPFDLTGRVIRVQPHDPQGEQTSGMGIEFMDVDDEKRARLERFVDRLRAELPDDEPVKK